MSELDRALDAELDRFRPGAAPAFAGLRRRARRRRQGRLAGGSVLAIGMVAAVAVLVPGRLAGTDQVAEGSATPTVTAGRTDVIMAGFSDHRLPGGFALEHRPDVQRCAPGATITQLLPNDPFITGRDTSAIAYRVAPPRGQYDAVFGCLQRASGVDKVVASETSQPPPRFSYGVQQLKGPPADPAVERLVRACLSPPGDVGVQLSNPPIFGTVRVGQMEALAFTRCVGQLPNVRVTQTSTTAPETSAVDVCLDPGAQPATEYVGLLETTATNDAGPPVRVVGRDRVCLGHTRDLRFGRIDLVVDRGVIVAASREG